MSLEQAKADCIAQHTICMDLYQKRMDLLVGPEHAKEWKTVHNAYDHHRMAILYLNGHPKPRAKKTHNEFNQRIR